VEPYSPYFTGENKANSVAVLCTFENPTGIFSTNIIATLSLSTIVIW